MAEVDVSSYPRPAAPVNALDVAGKLGGLQQQQQQIQSGALTIDKQKLDLVNQRFGTFAKQIIALRNKPDLNESDIHQFIDNDLKLGILTPELATTLKGQIPAKATSQQLGSHLDNILTNAQSTLEAINYHLGTPGTGTNQQQQYNTLTSPKPGFGVKTVGAPIQIQNPPGTPSVDENGQRRVLGPQLPVLPPGTVGAPGYAPAPPVQNRFPLPANPATDVNNPILGPSTNAGGTITGFTVGPNTAGQPLPTTRTAGGQQPGLQPTGPATETTPMFEKGMQKLNEDQAMSTARLTAVKPAMQALPLLQGLTTGPGTAKFNEVVAGLSNLGLIPQGLTDKTAIYQEVSKKLANYVGSSPAGQRSDAAQTLAEAYSPNPKSQINPALIKLTKDAIALDRVQAARALAFEGNDYSKYGNHAASFPAKIDERAFGIDLMDQKERDKLLETMDKKLNSSNKVEQQEAKKFRQSLQLADKLGILNPF